MALSAVAVTGAAFAASQGSQANPLVTLSYLNEVLLPQLLSQVDEKVEDRIEELELRGQGGAEGVFRAVEVPAGKRVELAAGTQMLFRGGNGKVSATLADLTAGVSAGSLTVDHLYLATAATSLTVSEPVTILVQGTYSVS